MRKVVIMGAAGRDFHNFNVFFRNNKDYRVVAFTAAQIPHIEDRVYPPELAGPLYPEGIPIRPEEELREIIEKEGVDLVVLSYSDLSFDYVMKKASQVLAWGASFMLLGPRDTMLVSKKPVVAVTAVRTGCGKSPLTRYVARFLRDRGYKVVIVRHPMPYGEFVPVQRFEKKEDLQGITIEEREEYEPLISEGFVVYAGVDYGRVLEEAEKEADIIIWDGGNNDLPFFKPDLHVVVADPHRAGHEVSYYPGMSNLIMADVVVISKVNTADQRDVIKVEENVERWNPGAEIVYGALEIEGDAEAVGGKKVCVVEDGPTVTHGEMPYGAGYLFAKRYGEVVDPRKYAVGSIKAAYEKYRHLGPVVPALGYYADQLRDLEATLRNVPCEVIVDASPVDLTSLIDPGKPVVRIRYEFRPLGDKLDRILSDFLQKLR